jgi:hypothetical protein
LLISEWLLSTAHCRWALGSCANFQAHSLQRIIECSMWNLTSWLHCSGRQNATADHKFRLCVHWENDGLCVRSLSTSRHELTKPFWHGKLSKFWSLYPAMFVHLEELLLSGPSFLLSAWLLEFLEFVKEVFDTEGPCFLRVVKRVNVCSGATET